MLTSEQLKKYWDTANILRKNLDAAEYKHIVLGLVFLKYVSDSFTERREELQAAFENPNSERYKPDAQRLKAALDDRNYYKEVNVFWVPESSRWELIQANSKQPDLATLIDNALYEIEKENPKLEGIVERRYADARLPAADLGAVVDLIGSISFGLGRHETSDVLGQVYEFFLGNFANAEGKNGGQFYTTPSIVKTLVEIIQPMSGRVYDPCCGSGGMFVQSEKFLEAHGGKLGDIAIYGQESNPTTRRLCAMNLAIRGIDFDLGKTHGDTFMENQHSDKRFDYVLMNPPFGSNASYPRNQLLDDVRWKKYGVPREKPANYAWMSHAVHHLSPKGRAGIVMPHASLTSSQFDDLRIRKAFLEDDIVECIIDLPGQLFFNTPIPSCLWFFNKAKSNWRNNRKGQVLFIDARNLGTKISKTQIEFSSEDINLIVSTFESWANGAYQDIPGFCSSAHLDDIESNGFSLSPSRYAGTEETKIGYEETFAEAMQRISTELATKFEVSKILEKEIGFGLSRLGFEPQSNESIDISTSISENLIELVNRLFRSWFIEFEPVQANFENTTSLGLSANFQSLFPKVFVPSSLGPIPEGYTVVESAEIFDIGIGRTPPRKESQWFTSSGEGIPWLSIRDMGRFAVYSGNTSEGLTPAAIERFNIPVIPKDVVLMSFKLTVGKLCISDDSLATNEAIAHFVKRRDNYLSSHFIYLWLKNFDMTSLDSTSSIGNATNSKLLRKIPFLLPDRRIIQKFDEIVEPMFKLIRLNNLDSKIQSKTLSDEGEQI